MSPAIAKQLRIAAFQGENKGVARADSKVEKNQSGATYKELKRLYKRLNAKERAQIRKELERSLL